MIAMHSFALNKNKTSSNNTELNLRCNIAHVGECVQRLYMGSSYTYLLGAVEPMDSLFTVRRRLLLFNLASAAFFGMRLCSAGVGSGALGIHLFTMNGPTFTFSWRHVRDYV